MQYYKTKDDIIAAIFLSLGINLISTQTDESRKKIYFVFNINVTEGRALETLIKKNDPRIKVVAGVLHSNLEFVRSWLYLSRLKMQSVSERDIEQLVKKINPNLLDESPPLTAADIADEILEVASMLQETEDVV